MGLLQAHAGLLQAQNRLQTLEGTALHGSMAMLLGDSGDEQ